MASAAVIIVKVLGGRHSQNYPCQTSFGPTSRPTWKPERVVLDRNLNASASICFGCVSPGETLRRQVIS